MEQHLQAAESKFGAALYQDNNLHDPSRVERGISNADSLLLRLPAELRNEIYRLCIDHSPRTTPGCGVAVPIEPGTIPTEDLKLSLAPTKAGHLRACRALRGEALSLFYGGKIFTMTIHTGSLGGPGWLSYPERWLASLPDDAFQYLRDVRVELHLRALRNFARSATCLAVDLRGDERLPAFVRVNQQLHPLYDQREFQILKSRVQRFVDELNERKVREVGIRKDDIGTLIDLMKGIIREDRARYSDWGDRILGIYHEGRLIKCRTGFPYD